LSQVSGDQLLELMQARRSIRRYTDQPVARGLIDRLIEAAIWAPSAHNRQPWRFAVIDSADIKHKLATAMGEQLKRDLSADNVPQPTIDSDVSRSYQRITNAPALILLCLTLIDMDQYVDDVRNQNEETMAIQSVAMAGQNLLLAAHAYGLGACWMCAPLFCQDVVRDTLQLSADWQPQGLITLGYPAQTRSKDRMALESIRIIVEQAIVS
jgi:F420 biosynthesis protein FbiB-like protein